MKDKSAQAKNPLLVHIFIVLGGVLLTITLFYLFYAKVGYAILIFLGFFVAAGGFAFGTVGGIIAGLATLPLSFFLLSSVQDEHVASFLLTGIPGTIGFTLMGILVGRLKEVQDKLSEGKKLAEKLKETEGKFSIFMDNTPVVGWIKDPQSWKYVYINKSFEKTFNIKLEVIKNKRDTDLWPREVAEKLRRNDAEVFTKGKVYRIYEDVPTPEGVMHHWLVFKFPIESTGKRLVGGTGIDITELKTSQDELARRTSELERMNELMVGRELKMAEMKRELKTLKGEKA